MPASEEKDDDTRAEAETVREAGVEKRVPNARS